MATSSSKARAKRQIRSPTPFRPDAPRHVQAQESVAGANESYISSLYSHNVAKIALARAIGYAEEGVKQYLKSK